MTGSQWRMGRLLGLIVSLLIVQTHAQTPAPACNRQNWDLLGPIGQSPCQVLADFMTFCATQHNTIFNLTSVHSQPLGQYAGPVGADPLVSCKCTDTTYNLYSACGACQSLQETPSNWPTHLAWFEHCPKQSQPGVVFGGNNEIELWMNQTYLPTFDIEKAVQVQSTNTPLPSQTTVEEATFTQDPTTAPTVEAQAGSSSGPNKSRTGAIIGGVVGIVIILAIIAFCIIYSIRYRRAKKRTPASAEFMKYAQGNTDTRKSATTPLTHGYHNSSVEENLPMRTVGQNNGGGGYNQNPRASIIRLDKDTGTNELDRVPMPVSRDIHHDDELPAFTPGLFKDPIFEKGVALNLAAAAVTSSSSGGHSYSTHSFGAPGGTGGIAGSPMTYSPATPSHPTTEHTRLIHGKQNSAGSAI